MSLISDLILEIEAAQAGAVEPWEGFKDLHRSLTDVDGPEAKEFVQFVLTAYTRRDVHSRAALSALRTLEQDSYPVDLSFEAPRAVLETLAAQQRTVTSAVGTISSPGEAAAADVAVGTPVPR